MVYVMDTEINRSEWVGRVIDGRFTLLRWLGGSEGSNVFLTELPEDRSRKAAIKLIPADDRDAEARIAESIAKMPLSHPHLMRLFYTGRCEIGAGHMHYAVTEYAEENLAEILPERPLTPTEVSEMLGPLLDALSYLHRKGFVHGHLKPSNILVVDDQLKLSWDNLHVAGESGKGLPAPSIYDAPESATVPVSPAVDIWSLGITLVEALTQHRPIWERSTETEPVVPESIPQPFAEIARECLRSDPARRCTLSDIRARLESARSLPEQADKTSSANSAKFRVTALVAAVLVLLAIAAVVLLRPHQSEPSAPAAEEQQPAPAIAPPQSPAPRTPAPEAATEEQRPSPAIATPAPQSSAPKNLSSKAVAAKDGVVLQVMPTVFHSASESIHGQISVRIRVTVDPSGNVSNAELDSPGPSKYFAKVALQAAQQWKFKPAEAGGQAVSSVWILQFQFTQSGTNVIPTEVSR